MAFGFYICKNKWEHLVFSLLSSEDSFLLLYLAIYKDCWMVTSGRSQLIDMTCRQLLNATDFHYIPFFHFSSYLIAAMLEDDSPELKEVARIFKDILEVDSTIHSY